jgi:signal transduction histidine kinase
VIPAWNRSASIVAAFSIAAAAVVVVGWRSIASERVVVERDARARLRAAASEGAGRIAAAVAQLQSRALVDPAAALVRAGRFVAPREPAPIERLRDSEGRDPVGDQLLEDASTFERDARAGDCEARYRAAASEDDPSRDAAVRRLACFRLAAWLDRQERRDEAAAFRARFTSMLDASTRSSAEGLFARIAVGPRDETLREDLLASLGSGDDAVVLGMLGDAGLADGSAISLRRAELERMQALRPGLLAFTASGDPDAAEPATGASLLAEGRVVAWARGEAGEVKLLEGALPELPPGVRVVVDPATGLPFPPIEPDRGPPSIAEAAALGPPLRLHRAEASLPIAMLDAEAARRVRLLLGGLGLLLLGGTALLLLTLRAVRRESEASSARAAFVARVSHDLRTPLSVIRMYAETLAQGRATRPEEVREFAGVAAREATRLSELVARVLDFSRVARRDRDRPTATVDVGELVQQAAAEHAEALVAASMRLEVGVNGDALLVRGDREGLRGAVANLVENAIRHASSGACLEIAASEREGSIEVRVADRGPGLPPGLEERIFEPFVRGPGARPGGSGLGLALVREVATAHGGRIAAGNREGGGAIFVLALPRAPRAGADG